MQYLRKINMGPSHEQIPSVFIHKYEYESFCFSTCQGIKIFYKCENKILLFKMLISSTFQNNCFVTLTYFHCFELRDIHLLKGLCRKQNKTKQPRVMSKAKITVSHKIQALEKYNVLELEYCSKLGELCQEKKLN